MLAENTKTTSKIEGLHAWLAVLRLPQIGIRRFHALLEAYGDPAEFLKTTAAERKALGLPTEFEINIQGLKKDLAWLAASSDHTILTLQDSRYPLWLKEIPDAPPVLFVKGNVALLQSLQLVMVGSRNPSPLGAETAYEFALHFAKAGIVITSGLALGIDTSAHQGALAGRGKTIAVLGTSLEHIYPSRNKPLAKEIVAQDGALVSEFPIGTPPIPENFPRRNRIISGLGRGVVVVEATLRSGSLITARFANEQGREVFAIPGSIHNPMARGCHALIKQGAKLAETAADVLEEVYGSQTIIKTGEIEQNLSSLDQSLHKLLKCIGFEPTPMDKLIEQTEFEIGELTANLLTLELKGYITTTPLGYVRVRA